MKRKDENLCAELLKHAHDIASSEGYDKISVRALANRAGIATGTVYNYFTSKDEILLALTNKYWYEALIQMDSEIEDASFDNQLQQIYQYLYNNVLSSPHTLMSSLSTANEIGQQQMMSMQTIMGKMFICYIEKDNDVLNDVWTDFFTKEKFINFIIGNIVLSLRMRAKEIDFLVEIVRRTLY